MRKIGLFCIVILALLLLSADTLRLVQLTIINKGDKPIGVRMTGLHTETFYYLTIPAGSQLAPTERSYTVVTDLYTVQVLYLEYWDPVYGFSCASGISQQVALVHNTRLVFLQCGRTPPNRGEPTMRKFWSWRPRYRY